VEGLDVLVLGDANPDLVLRGGDLAPVSGQREAIVDEATLTVGGSGAIFACAAARLGLRTAFVGVVGRDVFGVYLRERLGAEGVDVRALVDAPERPTGVSVILSRPDDRGIYTAPGTIGDLAAADIDLALVRSARHVHVSSYFLQAALRPGLPELFDAAHATRAATSVDPNWDPSEEWDAGLLDLLPLVDLLLPNAAEVARSAGIGDPSEAARALATRGPVVAVKDGARGGIAARGDELATAAAPRATILDTTGAGDAFDAGFILGTLEGWQLERTLAFANACGTLSCRAVGGVDGLPTRDEALALLGAS
jgi:sugar/nucleoside kinase (ribokinase family)